MSLRIVMMGTGSFALPTFWAALESRHHVVGLFTQPDRTGRGHHHHANPLKAVAEQKRIPVFQPQNVNVVDAIELLKSLKADLCLVAAYGQILSAELLRTPRLGAINVHASILPKFRGAAPIQAAILNGEAETGVTIFQIEPKLDAGPVFGIVKTPIGLKETSGDLEDRLAVLGASLALAVIDQILAGTAVPLPQDSSQASRAPRLKKESGQIDWIKTPRQIDCHVRAVQPWPLASTTLVAERSDQTADPPARRRMRIIVLEVDPSPAVPELPQAAIDAPPGTVLIADRKRLVVQTGEGRVEILRLQPEGKRGMASAAFLCGYNVQPGDRFESAS